MKSIAYRALRKLYHEINWFRAHRKTLRTLDRHFGQPYARLWHQYDTAIHFRRPDAPELTARKNSHIKAYLTDELQALLCDYRSSDRPRQADCKDGCVWVFWWSGIDTAPPIVQAAVRSIRACSPRPVRLLDQHSYAQYVQLPGDILEKHDAGVIGHAHFSDILRLSLLAAHGGLWIDATVFLTRPIPETVFAEPFFSCKQTRNDPLIPSHHLWAGWLLGGSRDFPLFSFVRDALIQYWRSHDTVIDYLLMDYLFDIAYEQLPSVHAAIDALQPGCPDRHRLMERLNEPYDPAFFDRDTWYYKLSYRYGAPKAETADGAMTFYGYLINEAYL